MVALTTSRISGGIQPRVALQNKDECLERIVGSPVVQTGDTHSNGPCGIYRDGRSHRGRPAGRQDVASCLFSMLMAAAGSAISNSGSPGRFPGYAYAAGTGRAGRGYGGTRTNKGCVHSDRADRHFHVNFYFLLERLTSALILVAALGYIFPYTLWLKRSSPFGARLCGRNTRGLWFIGAAAVMQSVRPDCLILFFILLLWVQPPHFWILCHEIP